MSVIISDIHGDFRSLVSILIDSHIVDDDLNWCGDALNLIVLGDILDMKGRCASSYDEMSESMILTVLIKLKIQAPSSRGCVYLLLGNHEIMNVLGDFSFVSQCGMNDFNGMRNDAMRPNGYIAKLFVQYFSVYCIVNNVLYSHLGFSSMCDLNKLSLETTKLLTGKVYDQYIVNDYFFNTDITGIMSVRRINNYFNVRLQIVGHYPVGVASSFDNSIVFADNMISGAFGKKKGDKIYYLYDNGVKYNVLSVIK